MEQQSNHLSTETEIKTLVFLLSVGDLIDTHSSSPPPILFMIIYIKSKLALLQKGLSVLKLGLEWRGTGKNYLEILFVLYPFIKAS